MGQDSTAGTTELDGFALGVRHHEMESALEAGRPSAAREAIDRILEVAARGIGSQSIAEAYTRLDGAIQAGPPVSSPLLLAANLRRLMTQASFYGTRFQLGFWASGCRLAAARRDGAFFAGREANHGWSLARRDSLPQAAHVALETARRLLDEHPSNVGTWRRLEEAFRHFILLL